MIHIQNLAYAYGKKLILQDISVEIPANKITAIIGTNGCGKSTLLKNIAKILSYQKGCIQIDGEKLTAMSRKRLAKKVAFLPQNPEAPEGLTVREIVELGRHPYQSFLSGKSVSDAMKVEQALKEVSLTEEQDKLLSALSGGQKQRAWLAMTLAQDTPILLLDEPTTFLDIQHQKQLLELLHRLNQKLNKTIVMVLHDLNQVNQFADYIVALKAGKLVTQGYKADVMNKSTILQVFNIEVDFLHNAQGKCDYIAV
ncbi:ABC transporter ATP-binding protein [Fangia hongkongensis]|uniref:ABC transporter ATP-binding protein n=1 Tax=Fangia hongkongensis TaxID=270495 RepID=UPI00035C696E|nr:ABC transporter ATP-binding protein [Fangia hongkongensis]MBK2124520.1 ABC transporter ATP-binding protein [Fangia hongkongensis]